MYRESNLVELKQQLTDELKCEIDAFLNTKGGTIYIGVADDGTVMPFADEKSKDEADLKIGSWIREAFFPMPVDLILMYIGLPSFKFIMRIPKYPQELSFLFIAPDLPPQVLYSFPNNSISSFV